MSITTATAVVTAPVPETIYEICCILPNGRPGRPERLLWRRGHQTYFRTAAEAAQALADFLGPGACSPYTIEESTVEHGRVEGSGRHTRVVFPTRHVHVRRVVAHAVPLPTATLPAYLGILSFTVRDMLPAAAAAGLRIGDRVTQVGDCPVEDEVDLRAALKRHQPGEVVPVEVRRGEQRLVLALKLVDGEPTGRYALEVLSGVDVPPLSRFDRITVLDRIDAPMRPLRS